MQMRRSRSKMAKDFAIATSVLSLYRAVLLLCIMGSHFPPDLGETVNLVTVKVNKSERPALLEYYCFCPSSSLRDPPIAVPTSSFQAETPSPATNP